MKLLSLFFILALSTAVFANNFDENGILCESNLTYATMDLVVVVEVTDATAGDKYGVMGSLLTYLSTLPITNSDTGIRLALVTYGKTAVTSYNFNTIQSLYAFKNALVQAFDNTPSTGSGDIQVGLSTAYTYIQNTPSSNVPAILLFATTYDDSGVNDPNATATDIKGNNIKIMTLTYTPYLGVSSPKIALLASPGLAFDARFATPNVTNKAFAAMNCVCQSGWTQLFVNDNYYSECFKVAGGLANRIGAVLEPGAIFVTLQSRERKDYIEANVVYRTMNTLCHS